MVNTYPLSRQRGPAAARSASWRRWWARSAAIVVRSRAMTREAAAAARDRMSVPRQVAGTRAEVLTVNHQESHPPPVSAGNRDGPVQRAPAPQQSLKSPSVNNWHQHWVYPLRNDLSSVYQAADELVFVPRQGTPGPFTQRLCRIEVQCSELVLVLCHRCQQAAVADLEAKGSQVPLDPCPQPCLFLRIGLILRSLTRQPGLRDCRSFYPGDGSK